MKGRLLFLLLLGLGFNWDLLAQEEDCSSIAEFPQGRQWVYQWYDADDKTTFKSFHTVSEMLGPSASTIKIVILNDFQDTVYRGNYQVKCTPQGLYQDLLAKLTPDMLSSLEGLDIRTEEQGWVLPRGMHPGDSIPQSFSKLSAYSDDAKILELSLAIGPVRILEQESLNTPAGGFPCVAMAYELWITQVTRKRFRLRDWFAPGVGVIRREVFDRRGHFFGHCELVNWKEDG